MGKHPTTDKLGLSMLVLGWLFNYHPRISLNVYFKFICGGVITYKKVSTPPR
jgi:hypothetical protein